LHYRYRPQLYAALLIVAPVLVALTANKRRADYVALLVGFIVAWALVIVAKPHARKGLIIALVIFAVLIAGYVAAFSNASGILAEPARAIISIYHPDPRDALSNLYRTIENYDLKYTAKLNPLGLGFGKEFFQPYVLPNILAGDPYYLYIPHNTIYWVWMRLGVIGFCALWYLIAAIIVRGCLIVRQLRDRYLQLVAIYVVAITFMEVFVAYADYQLSFYRNVIYLGLMVGVLMKLPSLEEKKEQPVHENSHRVSPAAASRQRRG
jgi:cell division protein FtsW (lipid II flippase)